MSRKRKKITLGVTVRGESGEGGVAGERRLVGVPKFHSWGKCTMPLTNINSDWMSNTSSGLCIILHGPLSCILGVTWTPYFASLGVILVHKSPHLCFLKRRHLLRTLLLLTPIHGGSQWEEMPTVSVGAVHVLFTLWLHPKMLIRSQGCRFIFVSRL